jgi:thiamine pyrophosphate-dependent acetolactate synthase large subunit-like protein
MAGPTTAERILSLLHTSGVTTAFGLPGVHNLAFWSVRDKPLELVTVRHEQTAAFAADGQARATGGLGVALVTSGPGAANTVAAIGEAAASGSPVLLVASDVPVGLRAPGRVRGLLHESRDQGALFEPLVKAVLQPTSPEAAVAAATLAVETALGAPSGPVYLGIPADVLSRDAPAADAPQHAARRPASAAELTAAAELVNAARRPVIWAGGGVVSSGAVDALDALAWRLGAPVVTTYAGRGSLSAGHPLLVDAPVHEPVVDELIASADLLLVLGSALDGMSTRNWAMARPDRVIDVNLAPSGELRPDLTVVGDVRSVVEALAVRLRPRDPWADAPFALRDVVRRTAAADPRTASAVELVEAVERAWPDDGVVVCDMAVAGYWVGGYAAMARPRRLAYPVGWGTLGFALPAAIGAATTGRPTLAVVGDGGLAMAVGELATVVQHQLPVTLLVVDDGGYGMLRFDAGRAGRPTPGLDLVGPDWSALAAAYGISAVEVHSPEQVALALSTAADDPAPTMVVWRTALYPPRSTSPRWADPD